MVGYGKYRRYKRGYRRYKKKFGANSRYRRFVGFDKRRKLGIAKFSYGKTGATEVKSKDTIGLGSDANHETLYLSNQDDTAVAGSAKLVLLNATTEGASFYNRIARRIRMKSITIIWRCSFGDATLSQPVMHRILVVYDRQSNGVVPVLSDILQPYSQLDSGGGAVATQAYSGLNMNNRDRYLVLKDTCFLEGDQAAAGTVGMISTGRKGEFTGKWFIKLKGMETHYKTAGNEAGQDGTSNYACISTGALYLVAWSTGATGSTPALASSLNYIARLKFYD